MLNKIKNFFVRCRIRKHIKRAIEFSAMANSLYKVAFNYEAHALKYKISAAALERDLARQHTFKHKIITQKFIPFWRRK